MTEVARPERGSPEWDLWVAAIDVAIAAPMTGGVNVFSAKVPWTRIDALRTALDGVGIDWRKAHASSSETAQTKDRIMSIPEGLAGTNKKATEIAEHLRSCGWTVRVDAFEGMSFMHGSNYSVDVRGVRGDFDLYASWQIDRDLDKPTKGRSVAVAYCVGVGASAGGVRRRLARHAPGSPAVDQGSPAVHVACRCCRRAESRAARRGRVAFVVRRGGAEWQALTRRSLVSPASSRSWAPKQRR
jgi:hypothetical protein